MTTNIRRLLSPAQLAEKLGYTRLNPDLAAQLERLGFPAPVLGGEAENRKAQRWDERAIDLWLDARMPAELRERAGNPDSVDPRKIDPRVIAQRLARKAQEIHL